MNSVGPICNESFIKKKVCGSREQYTGPTRSALTLLKRTLKKTQMHNKCRCTINL